jgi:type I restriction enzyme R subunit
MFRTALTAYVRLYSFLSQVMPFADPDLERLYTYGRFLELKLPVDPRKAPLKISDAAVLTHYRIEKIEEGKIALKAGEQVAIYGPPEAGSRRSEVEEVKLSEVIDVLNERFGTHFTKADQVSFFDGIIEEAKADEEVKKRAVANTFDNFSSGWLKKKISDAVVDRMSKNGEIATRYLNDPEFENAAFEAVVKRIYDELRKGAPAEAGSASP